MDDNRDFLELLKRYLSVVCPDYEISTFQSPTDAADFLHYNHVDLIITDCRMPQLDGFQLISIVRRNDPGVPIVMVSDIPVETAALARGASAYVPKSAALSRLGPVLERLGVPVS